MMGRILENINFPPLEFLTCIVAELPINKRTFNFALHSLFGVLFISTWECFRINFYNRLQSAKLHLLTRNLSLSLMALPSSLNRKSLRCFSSEGISQLLKKIMKIIFMEISI